MMRRNPVMGWFAVLLCVSATVQAQIRSRPDYAPEALARSAALQAVAGAEIACVGGRAASFPCEGVDLLSFMPIGSLGGAAGVHLNDLWGWTDPATGREYALVGRTDGTAFVDVTDPLNPVYVGQLPLHDGARASAWRDVKTYGDYAFIVADGAGDHGLQVFDLTQLRSAGDSPVTFAETAHYAGFGSAHNVVLNEETGFAYAVGLSAFGNTCGRGMHIVDVRDPVNPQFAGCFSDAGTRRGYTHDAQCVVYRGPDADHQGKEICVGANEDAISIVDVSNKARPLGLAVATYPGAGYVHQGWFTEDHRYFFQDDELDERNGTVDRTRTIIWDLSDLDDPQVLAEYLSDHGSIDHNQYVRGRFLYQANYTTGLRILDVGDVRQPREVAFFDTYPQDDATGFRGAWSVYPFFESGTVVVSSIGEGLFVVRPVSLLGTELAAFDATVDGTGVDLAWQTRREQNNAGFAVEHRQGTGAFAEVDFVPGHGTTAAAQTYQYHVAGLAPGRHGFRLKVVDQTGAFWFSAEVEVFVIPGTHVLSRVFPNPFQDRATLTLVLKSPQRVRVEVYDAAGRRVAGLHDGPLEAEEEYRFTLDGAGLAGGLYMIRAVGERFVETQEVMLVR